MFDRIRKILFKPQLSEESHAFFTQLADSPIWILAVGLRGTPEIGELTEPSALDIIAAHRIDVSEIGDDDSLFPFNFQLNGKQVFPFFSSEKGAKRFATEKNFPTDITVFEPICMQAGFVATPENDLFELVLDPGSPTERTLTREERLFLRSISTPG